jgi:hypothetical protein
MFNTFSHVTPLRVSVGLLQFRGSAISLIPFRAGAEAMISMEKLLAALQQVVARRALRVGGHFRIVCGRSYNPLRCLADHLPEVIADEQATKGQP